MYGQTLLHYHPLKSPTRAPILSVSYLIRIMFDVFFSINTLPSHLHNSGTRTETLSLSDRQSIRSLSGRRRRFGRIANGERCAAQQSILYRLTLRQTRRRTNVVCLPGGRSSSWCSRYYSDDDDGDAIRERIAAELCIR